MVRPYRHAVDGGPGSGLRAERLTELDGLLAGGDRRPAGADAADAVAGRPSSALRTRLLRVHARCQAVDAASWAGYVADLDRGIDELHVELAMAAQRPVAGPTVDDVLLARTSALELDAWRLALDAGPDRPDGAPGPRPALAAAEAALARYRQQLGAADPPSRAELETATAALRRMGPGPHPDDRPQDPAAAPASLR